MITIESLMTSPAGFGLTEATPAQRAKWRIWQGRPLAELRDHPDVLELVGGPDAVAALPSERKIRATEFYDGSPARTAKTMGACAGCIALGRSVDVSMLKPGETPRVSWVSLKLDVAQVAPRMLHGLIDASQVLSRLEVPKTRTATSVTLWHEDGVHQVEIACVAGAEAGGSLVARWCASAFFDEAPRMHGSDRVVSLEHARTSVLDRLLPGAAIFYIGSFWAPVGPFYNGFTAAWQKPTEDAVALRGTGPLLNPSHWTPERLDRLQRQDPTAYDIAMGRFADPESGLLSNYVLKKATRTDGPLELAPEPDPHHYEGTMDPAEGGEGGNAWTLTIGDRVEVKQEEGDPKKVCRIALAREWRGSNPDAVLGEIAEICRRYRIRRVHSDEYMGSALVDLAWKCHGLEIVVEKTTRDAKNERYSNLATMFATGCMEIPPHSQLRRDLASIRKRITQTGSVIHLPRTSDGRHADYAPAVCKLIHVLTDDTTMTAEDYELAMEVNRRIASNPRLRSRWAGIPGRGF